MWYHTQTREVLRRLQTDDETGLSQQEAERRQQQYGKNVLENRKKDSLFRKFLAQFSDYMVIILLVAAGISFVTSLLEGNGDFFDAVMILLIVVLNAAIGVFQENKAEKALEALQDLSAPTVYVLRNGEKVCLHSEELVVGDIIYLAAGDLVPADARLLEAVSLQTSEAALTGESTPVSKDADAVIYDQINIAEAKNMVFSSSIVLSGHARAVVVETGMHTQVGKIAEMIMEGDSPQTPLQQKLARTGKTLGILALVICGLIFLMGLLRHLPAFDMFMTSISLAVAAIPEGLPAIVTIMLALGVQKMVGKNAIIRKLPAVETLGSATVICSDKTGTLTQNKMTVMEVTGDRQLALSLAALCNNDADPTERALIDAADKAHIRLQDISEQAPRIGEVPFDSQKKYMATLHRYHTGMRLIVKGAPDVLLDKCDLTPAEKQFILQENVKMASRALRVLAVAYKDGDNIGTDDISGLKFASLIGLIDPPRPEAKQAVETCRRAGIRAVMITGDHIDTARAIARDIGIYQAGDKAMTGSELSALSDDELTRVIGEYSVFARVTPEHKVRIVNALQRRGEVVAMTGDGVNDAPALKTADIGCAMGKEGTDVAKGAADMILTDDNFATIVEAVKQGRVIFSNIRKAVHFLLSSNIGEIITIFVAIFIGWPTPLIAIHLLWVNLITDSLPAIALGFEKADADIMQRRPISRGAGLFADGLGVSIVFEGIMIGTLALIAFSLGNSVFQSLPVAQTMAFAVLGLSQLVHAYNVRSERSVFKAGLLKNKAMNLSFLTCVLLQILVITIAPIAGVFKVVSLNVLQWLIVAALSLMPLVLIELEKLLPAGKNRKKQRPNRQRDCPAQIDT